MSLVICKKSPLSHEQCDSLKGISKIIHVWLLKPSIVAIIKKKIRYHLLFILKA
jgi:hypothetical protein